MLLKDKQWSTQHYTENERLGHVTLVKNLKVSHAWGKSNGLIFIND
jgi:hypothetical protein